MIGANGEIDDEVVRARIRGVMEALRERVRGGRENDGRPQEDHS